MRVSLSAGERRTALSILACLETLVHLFMCVPSSVSSTVVPCDWCNCLRLVYPLCSGRSRNRRGFDGLQTSCTNVIKLAYLHLKLRVLRALKCLDYRLLLIFAGVSSSPFLVWVPANVRPLSHFSGKG